MSECTKKNSHRGRPRKQPVDNETRLAVSILLYGLENKLCEDGLIQVGFTKLSFGDWETVCKAIKSVNQNNWNKSRYDEPEFRIGYDFYKNLLKIIAGEEDCDNPSTRSMDAFIQYVFENDGYLCGITWKDFLRIMNNLRGLSSKYFPPEDIHVELLQVNDFIIIGWVPEHFYLMKYLGEFRFKIIVAGDGMLLKSRDEILAENFYIQYLTAKDTDVNWDSNATQRNYPVYAPPRLAYTPHPVENL